MLAVGPEVRPYPGAEGQSPNATGPWSEAGQVAKTWRWGLGTECFGPTSIESAPMTGAPAGMDPPLKDQKDKATGAFTESLRSQRP